MDEIDAVRKLAEQARKAEAPLISVKDKIIYPERIYRFVPDRTLMYGAIVSSIAAAVLIVAVMLIGNEGDVFEKLTSFHDAYSNYLDY